MKYESITTSDVNNGLGCRVTLWVSGCTHHCKGCHNKKTWKFTSGHSFTSHVEQVLFDEIDKPYIKGITLSGGDPLDSPEGVLELLQNFRKRFGDSKDVWIYTGYTYEYCLEHFKEILDLADILVDGMFDCAKRDTSLAFRGSTNQRIIDLKLGKEIEL